MDHELARKVDGQWRPLAPFEQDGNQYPVSWFDPAGYDDANDLAAEMARLGVTAVVQPGPAPIDMKVLGQVITDVGGVPHRVWTVVPYGPEDLAQLKARLVDEVNLAAGAFRRRFVTDITGQDVVYERKGVEAERYAIEGDAGSYRYMQAEATRRGVPLAVVAAEVSATAAQWNTLDPEIEALRRAGVTAIGDGGTAAAAITARAAVDFEALLA